MNILPANPAEATEMAERLFHEWVGMNMPLDATARKQTQAPTIEIIQEAMAMAFGWESWSELISKVSVPHDTVYIDDTIDALDEVTSRLSFMVGYKYVNPWFMTIIQDSGAGHSPSLREQLIGAATPWGKILGRKIIAPGIQMVSAERRNGIMLSSSRYENFPKHLSLNSRFYEEHYQAKLVELAFPSHFKDQLWFALSCLDIFTVHSVPCKRENLSPQQIDHLTIDTGDPEIEPPARDEALNRDLNEAEQEVINYLAKCVKSNKRPIKEPGTSPPTLQDWIDCLSSCRRVDGKLPMTNERWRDHFYNTAE